MKKTAARLRRPRKRRFRSGGRGATGKRTTRAKRIKRGVAAGDRSKISRKASIRRHQRELRDLSEQHETVLASIGDAFCALDRSWRYIYANDRAAVLADQPKDKLLGRVIWDVSPGLLGGEFYERCQRAMASRQPDQFVIFEKSLGRWLDTRIYPTKDGIVIFRADVTEGKKQTALIKESNLRLKESEDRLRLATDAAGIGTFDYYPQTRELHWSDRCNELFGLPPGTKPTYEMYLGGVHPDDQHIVHETVAGVMSPGGSDHYAIEYRTVGACDGRERWVAERGRAVLDSFGRPTRFIGTILDITERRNSEIALERAKQEAEEANKAKDQFLAMLSHELRTPLTPVLMTIASLRRDPDVSEQLRIDLEMLQRNIQLEALLIDDLLDLTRIRHGKLELDYDAVDLHTLLEHALDISIGEIAEKRLTVTRQFAAKEHHVWGDSTRLQQVFWNLIKNAVKFTPKGGKIELRTHNDKTHCVIVEVADNGIGVEPTIQHRIFDAFEQGSRGVTNRHGGLGLGLTISKRVCDLHGGTISVKSAGRGKGATFIVRLKAMETSLLEGPTYFLERDAPVAARMEILLVEDHADTAHVLRRVLERAGYGVGNVHTVSDAKELAASRSFDLVISDVGLPDGSGLELMQHLRKTYNLTGIALSGFGMDEDVAASKQAGFAEHLTKPLDWERLQAAIERLTRAAPQQPSARAG